jgi:hypothetical protein
LSIDKKADSRCSGVGASRDCSRNSLNDEDEEEERVIWGRRITIQWSMREVKVYNRFARDIKLLESYFNYIGEE